MTTEQQLIKQAQNGDLSAFEILYERHYTAVYTYIYYRIGQRPLAEDLTGDVFERMVSKLDSYVVRERPFIAWLYTIAGNLVRNHIKRQNSIQWLPLNEQDSSELGSDELRSQEDNLMTRLSKKLNLEQLSAALNELTEDQKSVIILRFLKNEPISSVAKTLGKTETGIKALQRRAINTLRRELEKDSVHA